LVEEDTGPFFRMAVSMVMRGRESEKRVRDFTGEDRRESGRAEERSSNLRRGGCAEFLLESFAGELDGIWVSRNGRLDDLAVVS